VHADGHLAMVTRPAVPEPAEGWSQAPAGSAPHHTWFSTDDGQRGLAVLCEGLPEHEALPGDDGLTLALTLLRAVGRLSRSDLATRHGPAGPCRPTPDAQCLGTLEVRYGLLPYSQDPLQAGVPGLAAAFDVPLLARPVPAGHGPRPACGSLVSLEPGCLLLSALKCSEAGDRLVVRFYNPGTSPVTGLVRFGLPVGRVWRASAGETEIEELTTVPAGPGCQIPIPVGPAEIVSLLVERAAE
jgi:alpha-mannosidase